MSRLIGAVDARLQLPRAIDHLAEAARQAGPPGGAWLAGLIYPSVTMGLAVGWDGLLSVVPSGLVHGGASWIEPLLRGAPGELPFSLLGAFAALAVVPCLHVLLIPLYRLVAGLARLGPAPAWQAACAGGRSAPLAAIWRAGEGLALSAFGLWLQLVLMMLGALLALALPVLLLAGLFGGAAPGAEAGLGRALAMGLVLGPFFAVLLLYTLAVSVLNQLALHSLAHNRRGVGSALLHAWRLMRNDGWATARAILVDVLLFVTLLGSWRFVHGLIGGWGLGDALCLALQLCLVGFSGVVRAGYWARVYRDLGGLSPDDRVPGLAA